MIEADRIAIIGAHTHEHFAYGLRKGMPWPRGALGKDMHNRFKPITLAAADGKKNLLIAGARSFEAMGSKPLLGRYLMGVTRKVVDVQVLANGAILAPSFEVGLEWAEHNLADLDRVFFIGGRTCWEEGLRRGSMAYITIIHKEVEGNGLVYLNQSLVDMAKSEGFVHIRQDPQMDDWDGKVRVDFMDYFRHTEKLQD